MRPPAFQFYATDYLGSQRVQMLNLDEEGAYIRLLCFCWQHGSIPSKPSEIARLVGKGCSSNLARVVAGMFIPHPTDESKLVHDRLEFEKRKQAEWKEKCSAGGKKSAELKKSHLRVVQLPSQLPLQDSTHIPSPSPIHKDHKASGKQFSEHQTELTARFHAALNGQWENDRQKWMGRIKNETVKAERVLADMELAIKNGTIKKGAAEYAEDTWKKFV